MTKPDLDALARRYFDALRDEAQALVNQKILPSSDCAAIVSSFARIAANVAAKDAANHEAERERAYQMLEANGVPRERARSITNGIDVLAARCRKAEAERDAAVAEAVEQLASTFERYAESAQREHDDDDPSWSEGRAAAYRRCAKDARSLAPRTDWVCVPREPTEEMVAAGMAAMNDLVRPIRRPMGKPSIDELEKLLNSENPPSMDIASDGSVSTLEERTTTTRSAAQAAYKAMLSAADDQKG